MWTPRLIPTARMKYLGIVEALDEDIRTGKVARGERLPPQRAIAEALDVDLTTVTRAFNEARNRGLVQAQAGRGTFVSETIARETKPLVDLSMNIPSQPPDMDLRKLIPAGIAAILNGGRGLLNLHYQESAGTEADRHAAAGWLSARLDDATPQNIVIANGAQGALFAICDLLLARGDLIAAGALTYPGMKAIAARRGIGLASLDMDSDGIVPDDFARLCRLQTPKALYVIPNLDNPTTATMPEDRRQALVKIARKHDVAIFEDDPYAPLMPKRLPAFADLAPERTWHIATLSKCATPALRVAYVKAPDATQARRLAAILRTTILMAPPLMTALASRWISDGTLQNIAAAIVRENIQRQKLAARLFKRMDVAATRSGHHLWLRLPDRWRAADLAEHADRAGLSIVPASAFATADQPTIEAVRISLGVAPDRGVLEDALMQLADLIEKPSANVRAVV